MNERKEILAGSVLLLAALIWGGGYVASKVSLEGWTPFGVLALRFGFAAILHGILFRKKIRKTPRGTMRKGFVIGLLFFGALFFQLSGLQYTSSGKSAFICSSYVALVPFISWVVFRRKPGGKAFVVGILAAAGIGIISLNESLSIGQGEALTIIFPVFYGLMVVLISKYSREDTDSLQMTFFEFLTIAVLALLAFLVQGGSFQCTRIRPVIAIFYLIIPNTVVAMSLQNIAQRYIKATTASLLISAESIFGFLFSILIYHEKVTMRLLIGCTVCFSAILLNALEKKP